MSRKHLVASNLAAAFLAGAWTPASLAARAARACGSRRRWLLPLARRVVGRFTVRPEGRDQEVLARYIEDSGEFSRAWARQDHAVDPLLRRVYWVEERMAPTAGPPSNWAVPPLETPARLAAWLGVGLPALEWFADCRRQLRHSPPGPLWHYRYRWVPKRKGGRRLLEIPRGRLKALQRRLLDDLLAVIPAHDAVHSFCRGRSVASYVGPHAGRALVLHVDLKDFFPSLSASRVHALFRTAGYPRPVARLLTGLCTTSVPDAELEAAGCSLEERQRLAGPHLPQGAPTSPALANLCAFRLDVRLAALARAAGACYTRYADDLTFSGDEDFARSSRRFYRMVCRVVAEEGFAVHGRKTRFMHRGVRQQVAGVVLNSRPNLARPEFDRLKAILTNCLRHGPDGQNRDGHADFRAHLAGRIGYLAQLHPARGRRLRELFDRIDWGTPTGA